MENLLSKEISQQVMEVFEQTLQQPVQILFFGSETRCEYCEPTLALLNEITPLSDSLSLSIHDVDKDPQMAIKYRVDKIPGIVIAARNGSEIEDFGIRYAGMPSGHEFTSFINDLIMVSQRATGLNDDTRAFLSTIDQEILLQVFVTPT